MTVTMATDQPRPYVVGFLFSPDFERVLLIRKRRPAWQCGLFNGIGGKIEAGELPIEAMEREFHEEAGLRVRAWLLFHRNRFRHGAVVHYFAATDRDFAKAVTKTDEEVVALPAAPLPVDVIYNLPYLVPMARILLCAPLHDLPLVEAD